jgi:hypothetical protein
MPEKNNSEDEKFEDRMCIMSITSTGTSLKRKSHTNV